MHNAIATPRWALLAGFALLAVGICAAEAKPQEPKPAELIWGGDATGGEPYILAVEGKPDRPTGFEGDIAVYLAEKLGRTPHFFPGEWDKLPSHLQRGDCHIILNGYEWSAARDDAMIPTIPYFAYRIRLVVRKDSPILDWDDLSVEKLAGRGLKTLRVGVLKDSAAHRYLQEKYPHLKIEPSGDSGTTGVMKLVGDGTLHATVQDAPAVVWYLDQRKEFPDLHAVGESVAPVENSFYVLYLRKGDVELRDRLNGVLREAIQDGSLKRIYEQYGLWDADQAKLGEVAGNWPPKNAVYTAPTLWELLRALVHAAGVTVLLTCTSMPLAVGLGLGVAVARLYGPRWLAWPAGVYVEVVRGTPVLMQLFAIYFLLPSVGLSLTPFWAGVLGLSINYGAYEAENYRAGLLAVPRGQMEAALSLGMGRAAALWHVIIPQAVRLVIPPVTNDFISLFKDTSACIIISVVELTSEQQRLMNNNPRQALLIGLMTAVLYLLMSYPLSVLARRLEKRDPHVS
jgi:polar amino acid transport system substrate-binding protein